MVIEILDWTIKFHVYISSGISNRGYNFMKY